MTIDTKSWDKLQAMRKTKGAGKGPDRRKGEDNKAFRTGYVGIDWSDGANTCGECAHWSAKGNCYGNRGQARSSDDACSFFKKD
jgi:hypothetical protein